MNVLIRCLVSVLLVAVAGSSVSASGKTDKVLVFSLTKSYRHKSIRDGIVAIKKLGLQKGFLVDTSESVESFTVDNLKQYKTLIFLNPTGSNVFTDKQKQALMKYINAGGGLVGIHAATDFCYEWEWYGKMIGAYFTDHPKVQKARVLTVKANHKLVRNMPLEWFHTDEWYNFKLFNDNVVVLMEVDESSYNGGKMQNKHPITWFHKFDGGKVFYTALGHTSESYTDDLFLNLLWNGIKWTMGK